MKHIFTTAAYAASAGAFLAGNSLHADVIYTDIDPDVTVDEPGTGVSLDLNGDGTNDFDFFLSTTSFINFTFYGAINFYAVNAIFGAPQNDNALAAFTGSGGAYAYPYVIAEGIDIGPSAGNFLTNDIQTLAYQFYVLVSSFFYYPIFAGGEWVFGETDKFLGLKLIDGDSTYYGWMRLTVDPSNRAFTVKDIAYESLSDTPIETFITPTDVKDISDPLPEIWAFEHTIYVTCPQGTDLPAVIRIFDLNGRLVREETITDLQTSISLSNIPAGNYIVQLQSNTSVQSHQVFIK